VQSSNNLKTEHFFGKKKECIEFLMFICIFLVSLCIVYRDFLVGNRFLVSLQTASDSYGQFYPALINKARIFDKYGFAAVMDFTTAFGSSVSTLDIASLNSFASFWGEANVMYMFGIRQILFMFLTGIFIYLYTKLLTNRYYIAVIVALAYAFCGPILSRQLWIGYISEYLLFAMWLWSFEMLYKKKDVRFIPFCTLLMILNFDTYKIIIYLFVICVYILFRLLWDERIKRSTAKFLLLLPILPLSIIILKFRGIKGFINAISSSMASDRFQAETGGVSLLKSALERSKGLFWVGKDELLTLFVRTIGTNTPRVAGSYRGALNYLEGPAFYCGLLTLILIIPIWICLDRRKRILSGIAFICAAMYIFVGPLRIIANGFVKDTFKLSSFWIVVFLLFIFANGIDAFLKDKGKKVVTVVISECVIVICLGGYCILKTSYSKSNIVASCVLVLVYTIVIYIYKNNRIKYDAVVVILPVLVVFEVILQGMICVENIETMDKKQLNEKKYYNDYTIDALEYINNLEPNNAYRVDKQYRSYQNNDASAQNYYSYTYYIGGAGLGKSFSRFYDLFGIPTSDSAYNDVYSPQSNNYFDEIIGTKYILSKSSEIANYGYKHVAHIGDVHVFENEYYIPWVYLQNEYIEQNEFEKLPLFWRNRTIMKAAVVDEAMEESLERFKKTDLDVNHVEFTNYLINASKGQEDIFVLDKANDKNETVLLISAINCNTDPLYCIRLKYNYGDKENFYYVNLKSNEESIFEIDADVDSFAFMDYYGEYCLQDIEVKTYSVPRNIFEEEYLDSIKKIKESDVEIKEFNELGLKADVYVKEPKILCTSVPYWASIFVDDQPVDTCVVNYAFAGCLVNEGYHSIDIRYGQKYESGVLLREYKNVIITIVWMLAITLVNIVIGTIRKGTLKAKS